MDILRRLARWAWERDEVHQQATKRKILFQAVLYGSLFFLCLVIGGVLWIDGQQRFAGTVWLIGLGLSGFFGIIGVGWETLEYLSQQRQRRDSDSPNPERNELAPNISLSQDTKISFVITVLVLLVLGTVTYVLSSLQ